MKMILMIIVCACGFTDLGCLMIKYFSMAIAVSVNICEYAKTASRKPAIWQAVIKNFMNEIVFSNSLKLIYYLSRQFNLFFVNRLLE